MASTINATPTSSGLISTADNSGVLALQTGGTTAVTIDGSQKATFVNDASISGLTVGKGAGAVTGNSAVGYQALNANTSGIYNTVVGYQAGYSTTTGGYNTSVGTDALRSNTTAFNNSAFGWQSLYANTTGANNTGYGTASLQSNTTGSYNVALGQSALGGNTTASGSTAVGYQALQSSNRTGADSSNTAVGFQAGANSTTSANNTFIGYQSGANVTTGTVNICLGYQAGAYSTSLTTGNNNILIGNQLNASSGGVGQAILISATGSVSDKGSNTGFITPNGGGVYQGNNSATWSITSDERLKKNIVDNTTGLNAITAIQVRNFEYRTADEVTDLPKNQTVNISGVQLGAIAQEIQAILPECVKTESTGVMSVDTTNLTWYLINAVKELNAKITALENK
jgi:hypothetical protein